MFAKSRILFKREQRLERTTYLNRLSRLKKRFVWIRYVVESYTIELTLIDVRYSVVLASLRRADGRLQMILETVRREAGR